MRIYNATGYQISLPLTETQTITIASNSPSGNIIPSNKFISLLVQTYHPNEIALIVSGPFEINMCSAIPVTTEYVVQSLDEAIMRFKTPETPVEKLENEEKKAETVVAEPEPETVAEPEVKSEEPEVSSEEETASEEQPVKKSKKKK